MNHPGQSFYVREITRLIDEQINSVRRELSNMLNVGIIKSDSADNKLYYEVNQRFDHYMPLRAMFADQKITSVSQQVTDDNAWQKELRGLSGVRVVILAGVLVKGSASSVDLIVAGDMSKKKLAAIIKDIEAAEGRELSYSVLSYDEFYYRLSVRDKFITTVLSNRHVVLADSDNILKEQ
jgi:hypothetical protein